MASLAASLIPAGLKIAGSIIGGSKKSSASKKAEADQVAAENAAIQTQREANAQIQTNLAPYNQAGQVGLGELTRDLDSKYLQNYTPDDLENDPRYQYSVQQGQRAIDRAANARQGVFSGRQLEATSNFGQQMALNQFDTARQQFDENRDSAYNKLTGLASIGANAVNTGAGAIMHTSDQVGSAQQGIGAAQANGALERGLIGAQTWTSVMDSAISAIQGNKGLSSMFAGSGG